MSPTQTPPPAGPEDESPAEIHRRQQAGNRRIAGLLAAVALLFLVGALGVAGLALYGPA